MQRRRQRRPGNTGSVSTLPARSKCAYSHLLCEQGAVGGSEAGAAQQRQRVGGLCRREPFGVLHRAAQRARKPTGAQHCFFRVAAVARGEMDWQRNEAGEAWRAGQTLPQAVMRCCPDPSPDDSCIRCARAQLICALTWQCKHCRIHLCSAWRTCASLSVSAAGGLLAACTATHQRQERLW